MPTSKDILQDAEKILKENTIPEMALKDVLSQGTADIAAFAKAKAELSTSLNAMKTTAENLHDAVKELNKGLTVLQKNEAVMKAPADAKAYKDLTAKFASTIKTATEYEKKLSGQIKKSEGMI